MLSVITCAPVVRHHVFPSCIQLHVATPRDTESPRFFSRQAQCKEVRLAYEAYRTHHAACLDVILISVVEGDYVVVNVFHRLQDHAAVTVY
jgi:hypothetical protein